jgi:hypothetical protein
VIQRAALIFGVIFVLVGLLGFFTSGMSMDADPQTAPRLLGLFPVNLVHNAVHLGLGAWGLTASRNWEGARNFCIIGGAIYLLLALLGFVSPDMFGMAPIGDNDIWLHIVLALALLAVGLTAGKREVRTRA